MADISFGPLSVAAIGCPPAAAAPVRNRQLKAQLKTVYNGLRTGDRRDIRSRGRILRREGEAA
jgi:hypothetical protein